MIIKEITFWHDKLGSIQKGVTDMNKKKSKLTEIKRSVTTISSYVL